jgi:hypothetical protein
LLLSIGLLLLFRGERSLSTSGTVIGTDEELPLYHQPSQEYDSPQLDQPVRRIRGSVLNTPKKKIILPPPDEDQQINLIPYVGADLIHFERNLLRIGFFAENEQGKGKAKNIRRLDLSTKVDGQKIQVNIEFRAPKTLPSSIHRDKFMAFLKIAAEQRAREGTLVNPIRFTGYRMLQELGLTDSGENYRSINEWGQVMADTTITSEKIVFIASSKRYANRTIHVFESFQRVGSTLDNKTAENYEVVLSDWLLDNLNANYVIAEDFAVYKRLKRPTARGIFGPLHNWFIATRGRKVERDYKQLCAFLGIRAYGYKSKIRSTMGVALDELVAVQYLSRWDVERMVTAPGYKILLWPGEAILRSINDMAALPASGHEQKVLTGETVAQDETSDLTVETQEALTALLSLGVTGKTAVSLVKQFGADYMLGLAEYANKLQAEPGNRIRSAAGIVVYWANSEFPIPASFETSAQRRTASEARKKRAFEEQQRLELEMAYAQWKDHEYEKELHSRYPNGELENQLAKIAKQRRKSDSQFARVNSEQHLILARQILQKELKEQMALLSFEQWVVRYAQGNLFLENPS